MEFSEEKVFRILLHGGNARSLAMEAIHDAKRGIGRRRGGKSDRRKPRSVKPTGFKPSGSSRKPAGSGKMSLCSWSMRRIT